MVPITVCPIKVGHIDDVQELRMKKPTKIPQRFVREKIERPKLDTTTLLDHMSSYDIPIINYSKLSDGNKVEILHLAKACEEWGFFQVKITIMLFDIVNGI